MKIYPVYEVNRKVNEEETSIDIYYNFNEAYEAHKEAVEAFNKDGIRKYSEIALYENEKLLINYKYL